MYIQLAEGSVIRTWSVVSGRAAARTSLAASSLPCYIMLVCRISRTMLDDISCSIVGGNMSGTTHWQTIQQTVSINRHDRLVCRTWQCYASLYVYVMARLAEYEKWA